MFRKIHCVSNFQFNRYNLNNFWCDLQIILTIWTTKIRPFEEKKLNQMHQNRLSVLQHLSVFSQILIFFPTLIYTEEAIRIVDLSGRVTGQAISNYQSKLKLFSAPKGPEH